MANYMRQALECVVEIAKDDGYYQLTKRVLVLPGSINADMWMPKLSLHMGLPLGYPGLTDVKEGDWEWNVLSVKGDTEDPLLTAPSSSDEEKA